MWYLTENMASPRGYAMSAFVATMNSVEIIGGSDGSFNLSSIETFSVSNGSFYRQTNLSTKRFRHTADYLNDRAILIAGGVSAFRTAEIYDPLLGVSNRLINMSTLRAWHTSSVIDEDKNSTKKLLLTGGHNHTHILDSGDVFNTEANNFTVVTNNMMTPRWFHTATPIGNGYVLLTGGSNASIKLDTLELYNSSSNKFVSLSSKMSTRRAHHTATYIPSIQAILIVGGWSMNGPLQTYDLFNVSTLNFTVLNGSTLNARSFHTATLLLDHRVLIVGGLSGQRLSSCELYDPVSKKFTAVANMSVGRADHTATLLTNTGQVLVCGGQNSNNMTLNSCELYQP
jgi:Kelch motif/Galactose oxidase, central domain